MQGRGCFADIDATITAAEQAYWEYKEISVETRKKIIAAIRSSTPKNDQRLGFGSADWDTKTSAPPMCAMRKKWTPSLTRWISILK